MKNIIKKNLKERKEMQLINAVQEGENLLFFQIKLNRILTHKNRSKK